MELQNNFTTPKQSQRLLKAGVPALSADCFYSIDDIKCEAYYVYPIPAWETFSHYVKGQDIMPCWSLGRLIDIVLTDADIISVLGRKNVNTQMEQVIKLLESGIIDLTNLKKIV